MRHAASGRAASIAQGGGVTREFLLHVQERLRKLREEKRRLQAELDSLQFGDNHVTSRHIRQVGRAVFVWGGLWCWVRRGRSGRACAHAWRV
jgi:hypothetical protein